jgi:hypothetical protein
MTKYHHHHPPKRGRKDLFGFVVSEVSAYVQLALLLGLWQGKTSWWKGMVEKSCSLHGRPGGQRREGREREGVEKRGKIRLSKAPSDLLFPTEPHLIITYSV